MLRFYWCVLVAVLFSSQSVLAVEVSVGETALQKDLKRLKTIFELQGQEVQSLRNLSEQQRVELSPLQMQLTGAQSRSDRLGDRVTRLQTSLQGSEGALSRSAQTIEDLRESLVERESLLEQQRSSIAALRSDLSASEATITSSSLTIADLEQSLTSREATILSLEGSLRSSAGELTSLSMELRLQTQLSTDLEGSLQKAEEVAPVQFFFGFLVAPVPVGDPAQSVRLRVR
tara:strand:+ start:1152 stop:1844 length:693 start_codon:yes stop_codon:yes gene_type:complete